MTGSTAQKLALACLTVSAVSACDGWKVTGETALDRLKPDAVAHAGALAGDDMEAARETGLTLLARLGALAGW